jgi:hypothetical protein
MEWLVRYGYDSAFVHSRPLARISGEQFIAHRPIIQAVGVRAVEAAFLKHLRIRSSSPKSKKRA